MINLLEAIAAIVCDSTGVAKAAPLDEDGAAD